MNKIVGIDLGTTNSLVAWVDAGIPLVMADAEGRRLTPSVVHFPGAEDPQTKTGDPGALKTATRTLDAVTHPLAEQLMDQTMETLLRQRGLTS